MVNVPDSNIAYKKVCDICHKENSYTQTNARHKCASCGLDLCDNHANRFRNTINESRMFNFEDSVSAYLTLCESCMMKFGGKEHLEQIVKMLSLSKYKGRMD